MSGRYMNLATHDDTKEFTKTVYLCSIYIHTGNWIFFKILSKQFYDSFLYIRSKMNYIENWYYIMQMAHVDAYKSYNMILGKRSGYINSSFLDDTGCTETEKVFLFQFSSFAFKT